MDEYINLKYVVSAVLFAGIGLIVFLVGACVIGIAIIIGSAIHG